MTRAGGGAIHVKKDREFSTSTIRLSSRVRARILVVESRLSALHAKLHDDDEGTAIDFGSVYVVSSGYGGGFRLGGEGVLFPSSPPRRLDNNGIPGEIHNVEVNGRYRINITHTRQDTCDRGTCIPKSNAVSHSPAG